MRGFLTVLFIGASATGASANSVAFEAWFDVRLLSSEFTNAFKFTEYLDESGERVVVERAFDPFEEFGHGWLYPDLDVSDNASGHVRIHSSDGSLDMGAITRIECTIAGIADWCIDAASRIAPPGAGMFDAGVLDGTVSDEAMNMMVSNAASETSVAIAMAGGVGGINVIQNYNILPIFWFDREKPETTIDGRPADWAADIGADMFFNFDVSNVRVTQSPGIGGGSPDLAAVPLPPAALMLLMGLAGLIGVRRGFAR